MFPDDGLPGDDRYRFLSIVIAALVAIVVLYSFWTARILLGVLSATVFLGVYLLWRLVRAGERIADALEADASEPETDDGSRHSPVESDDA